MMIASVPRLVEMIRESGALSVPQQQELLQLQDRFQETKALLHELEGRGWLTPYQSEQFLAGRHVDLIVGQFILLEPLGEGGMAQVFKARHIDTGEVAALKVIRKDHWMDSKVVRRFRREIEAVSQLSHPNLVMAAPTPETKNCQFLAMEYFEGEDLDRIIASRGPLPVATACDYVRQTALGLQYIHERGLIHRDIKPGNLLISPPSPEVLSQRQRREHWGIVRILDLGFVLLQRPGLTDTQAQLTKKGFLLGTVEYTAPEQADNPHTVDIRADLYSLGCSLYEMLTGRVPFPEPNPFKKLHQHQHEEPDPVELLRPGLPPEVVAVVKKLMAKDMAARYQKPGELAEEMTRILDGLDEAAIDWDWRPDADLPARDPAVTAPPPNPFLRHLMISLLAALAALAVASWWMLR